MIDGTFGPPGGDKPEGLIKRLAAAIGGSRNQWPTSLCRRLWEALMEVEPGRRRSPVHEARWLNLLGFALRPGYGLAVDDWRVAQTWTALQGKFAHATANVRVEGWILWRRIAGGLAAGQQQALADPLLGPVRSLHHQLTTGKGRSDFGFVMAETPEMWRLLGSLELLSPGTKAELGAMLLDLLPKRKMEPVRPALVWTIGRLGARVPLYGPLNAVVPAETAGVWLVKLLPHAAEKRTGPICRNGPRVLRQMGPVPFSSEHLLAVMQLARRTDDRYRDLSEKLRREAADWLTALDAPRHFVETGARWRHIGQRRAGIGLRRVVAERVANRLIDPIGSESFERSRVVLGRGNHRRRAGGTDGRARAALRGRKTILLEKNREPGVKILLAGAAAAI